MSDLRLRQPRTGQVAKELKFSHMFLFLKPSAFLVNLALIGGSNYKSMVDFGHNEPGACANGPLGRILLKY